MNDKLEFLSETAAHVAPRLLGCILVRQIDGRRLVGKIVETEAYDQADAASHSYRGKTLRNAVMFGPAGNLYVYFTYGMHYCCNIVVGPAGQGSAVLIRALEPLVGLDVMEDNRSRSNRIDNINLTNGPAKLCQALAIDKLLNGHSLFQPPLELIEKPTLSSSMIIQTTRIGISQAKEVPWRFFIKNNPYVSRLVAREGVY